VRLAAAGTAREFADALVEEAVVRPGGMLSR
jgi:hypothetical protein